MIGLFSHWKKKNEEDEILLSSFSSSSSKINYNSGSRNKPLVSKKKHGSFDYIIGFDDI
ncbi:MAG TPA: hypothetical protein VIP70_09680 [Nitrososphaeraceae archaeon]